MKLTSDQKREVFISLGAASMCWTGSPSGEFDSTRCEQIGNKLIAALEGSGTPAEQVATSGGHSTNNSAMLEIADIIGTLVSWSAPNLGSAASEALYKRIDAVVAQLQQ